MCNTFHHCLGPKKIENIFKDINFVIIVNLHFGGPSVKVDNFRFHGSQVHQLTIYNNIMNECAVVFMFNYILIWQIFPRLWKGVGEGGCWMM